MSNIDHRRRMSFMYPLGHHEILFLKKETRGDLPGSASEQCSTDQSGRQRKCWISVLPSVHFMETTFRWTRPPTLLYPPPRRDNVTYRVLDEFSLTETTCSASGRDTACEGRKGRPDGHTDSHERVSRVSVFLMVENVDGRNGSSLTNGFAFSSSYS